MSLVFNKCTTVACRTLQSAVWFSAEVKIETGLDPRRCSLVSEQDIVLSLFPKEKHSFYKSRSLFVERFVGRKQHFRAICTLIVIGSVIFHVFVH